MSAGCSPGSEKPVLVSRAITRQPAVNYADAPAALGLRRSVGHRPLVAPPAGFQRGGDPRYLANPRGLRVWALSRIPTVRLGDSQFRGVPRGQGWCAGRPRFRFPRSRFQCRRIAHGLHGPGRGGALRDGRVVSCKSGSPDRTIASIFGSAFAGTVMRRRTCRICTDEVPRYAEAAMWYDKAYEFITPVGHGYREKPRVIFCTSQECLRTSEFNRAAVHTVGVCGVVYRFTRIRSSLGCRSATGGV